MPKGAGNWGRDTTADVTRVVKDLARPSLCLIFQLTATASYQGIWQNTIYIGLVSVTVIQYPDADSLYIYLKSLFNSQSLVPALNSLS